IEVALLDVLPVIALRTRQAEQPLFEDRVLPVPQSEGEANVLSPIRNAGETVLVPTIRTRPRVIVGKVVPGRSVRAVVLADRPPRPLAQIGSPPLPVLAARAGFLQTAFFSIHDNGPSLVGFAVSRFSVADGSDRSKRSNHQKFRNLWHLQNSWNPRS